VDNGLAIETVNLRKRYKGKSEFTLDGLSLKIPYGALYGLLAPNGAGKTTAINIICGLRRFDEGEVYVAGHSVKTDMKRIKPHIGLVPQDLALFPSLTARENLKIFGGLYGLKGSILSKRVDELLELFDLTSSGKTIINHFSGGMKRRVNLIIGMLHSPEILILDEPTVGVDAQSRKLILDKLVEINRSGTTILFISHYLEEAEDICSEVALMDNGKIICGGKPEELYSVYECEHNLEKLYLLITGKKMRDYHE
jgi:ABC-2 type transport system ATP-binding protein